MSSPTKTPIIGGYKKVLLKNVVLWSKCLPGEDVMATSWGTDSGIQVASDIGYAIKPYVPAEPELVRHHVIVGPDGSIWKAGSLYLLRRALEGADHPTISGMAGDLCSFANALWRSGKDMWDFSGPKASRPTYFYKSVLKSRLLEDPNRANTENRKINRMVSFYRAEAERGFKPQQEMWKTIERRVLIVDKYGFNQYKDILSTDLTFKAMKANYDVPNGKYIVDGGKLRPIGKENQAILLEALNASNNVEMLLSHIVALTGGPRMQTIFTMRHSCIKKDAEDRLAQVGFDAGGDTMIDTKRNKREWVVLPEWVHFLIATYLESDRYKRRVAKSIIGTSEDQYIFLTETGKPYYVGKNDRAIFNSVESGSAVRKFQKETLEKMLKKSGKFFKYRFHDLRATFGMNLLEDLKKNGVSELAALDTLKNRLNHSTTAMSKRYADFKPTKEQLAAAQSEYEEHIKSLVNAERLKG